MAGSTASPDGSRSGRGPKAATRREREGSSLAIEPPAAAEDPDRAEVVALVDEEIDRLPERYRRAIVLCDLEGCTQPEAAGQLGWTEGSVRGRLARGREMLKSRLRRRGLVTPAGAIGGLAATDAAAAARLGERFVAAVTRLAGGTVAAGEASVSANAAVLAREVVGAIMRHKLVLVGLAAFVAGAAISGAGLAGVFLLKAGGWAAPVARSDVPRSADSFAQIGPGGSELPPLPGGAAPAESADGRPRSGHLGLPPLPKGAEDLTLQRLEAGPPPPPDYLPPLRTMADREKPPPPEPPETRRIAVRDVLSIEVLEALPGRPISGDRVVRPDGTISLGFYGDLKVAGLTRREAKVKVIEHLREFLIDRALGLIGWDEQEEKYHWIHPAWSGSVFVDDSPTFMPRGPSDGAKSPPITKPADALIQPGDRLEIRTPTVRPFLPAAHGGSSRRAGRYGPLRSLRELEGRRTDAGRRADQADRATPAQGLGPQPRCRGGDGRRGEGHRRLHRGAEHESASANFVGRTDRCPGS